MRLNLGCGKNHLPGYVNVDREAACEPDQRFDINRSDWPWETASVEEIRATHVLEHLDWFLPAMQEMHRILTPGGQIHIKVPHPRSDGFINDPTHMRPIMPGTLAMFSKRLNREWQDKGWPNTPLGLYLDVDFDLVKIEYTLTPYWRMEREAGKLDDAELQFAIDSHYNVVDEIYMVLQKVV